MICKNCGCIIKDNIRICPFCKEPTNLFDTYEPVSPDISEKVSRYMEGEKSLEFEFQPSTLENADNSDSIFGDLEDFPSEDSHVQAENIFDEEDAGPFFEDEDEIKHVNGRTLKNKDLSKGNDGEIYGDYKVLYKNNHIVTIVLSVVIVAFLVIAGYKTYNIFYANKNSSISSDYSDSITISGVADGQTYSDDLRIMLISNEGNRIYYSLDGSTPSMSSDMFTGAFELKLSDYDIGEHEITLSVVTYSETSIKAGESSVTFKLSVMELEMPVITPEGEEFDEALSVTISAATGATIYYTTDGTDPSEISRVYQTAIEVNRGTTEIRAMCTLRDG